MPETFTTASATGSLVDDTYFERMTCCPNPPGHRKDRTAIGIFDLVVSSDEGPQGSTLMSPDASLETAAFSAFPATTNSAARITWQGPGTAELAIEWDPPLDVSDRESAALYLATDGNVTSVNVEISGATRFGVDAMASADLETEVPERLLNEMGVLIGLKDFEDLDQITLVFSVDAPVEASAFLWGFSYFDLDPDQVEVADLVLDGEPGLALDAGADSASWIQSTLQTPAATSFSIGEDTGDTADGASSLTLTGDSAASSDYVAAEQDISSMPIELTGQDFLKCWVKFEGADAPKFELLVKDGGTSFNWPGVVLEDGWQEVTLEAKAALDAGITNVDTLSVGLTEIPNASNPWSWKLDTIRVGAFDALNRTKELLGIA